MSNTEEVIIPSEEQLTVEEVNLSGNVLKAGANHLGKACEFENNEFILCRNELDPVSCINEGKAVTSCALEFFKKVKKSCADEFMQYAQCIDKSSPDSNLSLCRKTQAVFDKCMLDNYDMERPPFDYFARIQVHKTERPKPEKELDVYPDAAPYLPEGYHKPPF